VINEASHWRSSITSQFTFSQSGELVIPAGVSGSLGWLAIKFLHSATENFLHQTFVSVCFEIGIAFTAAPRRLSDLAW